MTDTTANWRAMAAGRELDRIVAERLGEKISFIADDGTAYLEVVTPASHGWPIEYDTKPVPPYSTSTDAAQTSLNNDMMWSIENVWIEKEKRFVIRCDLTLRVDTGEGIGYADTIALAICRALLDLKDGATMTDEQPTQSRCPSCGSAMELIADDIAICPTHGVMVDYERMAHEIAKMDELPPRVPCPACEESLRKRNDYIHCTLCRGRKTVPPALGVEWTADAPGGE